MPVYSNLSTGSNAGEISITLMSPVSGINVEHSQVFWFVVIPIQDGIRGESVSHLSLNYQSGTSETIVISGLMAGESFAFSATAVNVYGSSQAATSTPVTAAAASSTSVTSGI